eukprot:scaffold363_cov56-Cylindrotheca_fusiformis.AAC.23
MGDADSPRCPISPAVVHRRLSHISTVSDLSNDDEDYYQSEMEDNDDECYIDHDSDSRAFPDADDDMSLDDDDELTAITLMEGVRLPLRKPEETYHATSEGRFVVATCMQCHETYYGVEDVSHIICARCWSVMCPENQTEEQLLLVAERGQSAVIGVTDDDIISHWR